MRNRGSRKSPASGECGCEKPIETVDPRWPGSCVRCGNRIEPRWTSNDATVAEFFDRLEECFPGETPAWVQIFRRHCEARELAGRDTFGYEFLARNNPAEGLEEAADGANYAFFDILQSRRDGDEEEWALALTAAYHFAHAYRALGLMHTGTPIPISDD